MEAFNYSDELIRLEVASYGHLVYASTMTMMTLRTDSQLQFCNHALCSFRSRRRNLYCNRAVGLSGVLLAQSIISKRKNVIQAHAVQKQVVLSLIHI